MAETAALLADEILPERPLRQWVLSLPHALRFLLATDPDALTLVLGVVYLADDAGQPVFRQVKAPGLGELQTLVEQIAFRIGRVLERRGLVERDIENAWLAGDSEGGPLDDLLGCSITYRIAVGPRAGQKLFTLQTVPGRSPEWLDDSSGAARCQR